MITLNLLPPAKKEDIILGQLYIILKKLIIFILFLVSLFAVSLLLTKFVLQNYLNQIVEDYTLTNKYVSLFSGETDEFNSQIKIIEEIKDFYKAWDNFFFDFFKLVPKDIDFTALTLNSNIMTIKGVAKNRDELLNFKKNLENSEIFYDVEIPIGDLLQKNNVKFNLKSKINLEKF